MSGISSDLSGSVEQQVRKLVADRLQLSDGSAVQSASSLDGDLHADSLAVMDLMMALEERFQIAFEDDDFVRCKTFGELVTVIQEKLDANAATPLH